MHNHKKHTKLVRPLKGKWGRNEWAIIGTSCDRIESLVSKLAFHLGPSLTVAYVDASHSKTEYTSNSIDFLLTQKEKEYSITYCSDQIDFDQKILLNQADIILINGNHFTSERQIVVIDSIKKESLKRKEALLTNVDSIVLTNGHDKPYDSLLSKISADTPQFTESDLGQLSSTLYNIVAQKNQNINGLILSGGKSSRLGIDKSTISYYGIPQKEYLANLLTPYCSEVFISENEVTQNNYSTLKDTFTDLGPLGGILSAFRSNPNTAWLTVAVDMPYINTESIEILLQNRDLSKIATCFKRSDAEFPDPLFTIWEPKSYQRILNFLAQGYSCPRKVLINSAVKVIDIHDDNILTNVNNPIDYEKVMGDLGDNLIL